jgi:hypothetical protein
LSVLNSLFAKWHISAVPATQEAETGRSFKFRVLRPAWACMTLSQRSKETKKERNVL